jgi:hypothetical protein
MSHFTLRELRIEYERAKSVYLKDPSYSNGAYLNQIAAELDRRLQEGRAQ